MLTPSEKLHFESGRRIIGLEVIVVSREQPRVQAHWEMDWEETPTHTHTLSLSYTHQYTHIHVPLSELFNPEAEQACLEREVQVQSSHHSRPRSRVEAGGSCDKD